MQFPPATLILLGIVVIYAIIVAAWFSSEGTISGNFTQISALQKNPSMWLQAPMVTFSSRGAVLLGARGKRKIAKICCLLYPCNLVWCPRIYSWNRPKSPHLPRPPFMDGVFSPAHEPQQDCLFSDGKIFASTNSSTVFNCVGSDEGFSTASCLAPAACCEYFAHSNFAICSVAIATEQVKALVLRRNIILTTAEHPDWTYAQIARNIGYSPALDGSPYKRYYLQFAH